MILRIRFRNRTKNEISQDWKLYKVPGHCTLRNVLERICRGDLVPSVDLGWGNVETCLIFTCVTSNEEPSIRTLQESNEKIEVQELEERNRKLYVEYSLEELPAERDSESPMRNTENDESDDDVVVTDAPSIVKPANTITDVLMRRTNHFPPLNTTENQTGELKQYNTFVNFLKSSNFGVQGFHSEDFTGFAKCFCKLLWEIDPHQSKFSSNKGINFHKKIKQFFGFNTPEKHHHKPKNLSALSLALKVNELKKYSERKYMVTHRFKLLKEIVDSTIEQVSSYVDLLEGQIQRTQKNHHLDNNDIDEVVTNFVATRVKMKVTLSTSYSSEFDAIRVALQDIDHYSPVNVSDLIPNNDSVSRVQRCRFINHLLAEGLPFLIHNVTVFHFRLPSEGPHRAIHFLWTQPTTDESNNPQHTKLICDIREKKTKYFTRSMKKEVRSKLLRLGVVKPHLSKFALKDLLGDESAPDSDSQRVILNKLEVFGTAGEDIIIDLRNNNGRKPKYDSFWNIVSKYISDKTAVDDRRHVTVDADSDGKEVVIVNMALAMSYADMYRTCIKIAHDDGLSEVPSYSWFLLQFWPCNRSTSAIMHHTGRLKVRRVVQSRALRKTNVDGHYARAVYKFLRKRAIKHRLSCVFLSADAKCKISVGEPGYPLAAVARGKKVIVGENEVFKVADHDYHKLSIIPDGVLVHDIPEHDDEVLTDTVDKHSEDTLGSATKQNVGGWYSGNVHYCFKNMVLQGSSSIRGITELGKLLHKEYSNSGKNKFNMDKVVFPG